MTLPASLPPVSAFLSGARPEKLRLGDVLLRQQLITEAQLQQALALQQQSGKKLGRVLVDSGILTEELLADGLSRQLRIPCINLKTYPFRPELVRTLPEALARRLRVLVLEERSDGLLVGMSDPLDLLAFDEITRALKRSIHIAVVAESQLLPAFDRLYRRTEEISGLARALEKDMGDAVDFGELSASAGVDGAPVVRLLQSLFEDAAQAGASDVHIEPQESNLQIRLRVDGVLQTQTHADKRIGAPLAQRIKLMAGLDISEKRLPQDGRFAVRLRHQTMDVRLSTLPGTHGESVVMRLLSQQGGLRSLDRIGMPPEMLRRYREILHQSSGMILVTGPTGSGKTSTLYASLAELNSEAVKIITVEDPVEYRLSGITQVQINEKIELDFAKVLRATLRQDPDVILLGEIRDSETAEIGLRAAITGHMVLSTLHTRDAVSTPFRLLDMGVPPFMVATSLQAVLAQRLVRLNCDVCAEPQTLNPQESAWLTRLVGQGEPLVPKRGRGCSACHGTGYAGRQGVYEMLEMNAELTQAASHADPTAFLKTAQALMAGKTLVHHALALVRAGRTSVAEAMRVGSDTTSEEE